MPAVTRLGDICTGHDGFPPRPSIEASTKVFASGKGVVRVGDGYAVHCNRSCHPGNAAQGSPKVFASGRQKMRIGDAINCGSRVAQGSSKVFIG